MNETRFSSEDLAKALKNGSDVERERIARELAAHDVHAGKKLLGCLAELRDQLYSAQRQDDDAACESIGRAIEACRIALLRIGPSVLPDLMSGLGAQKTRSSATAILDAFCQSYPAEASAAVDQLLKRPEKELIIVGLRSISWLSPNSLTLSKRIKEFIKSKDVQIRQEAVSAIASTGDDETIDLLIASLADSDTGVRLRALEGLHGLGHKAISALPVLVRLLENPELVTECARVISAIGHPVPEAVPLLVLALKRPHESVFDALVVSTPESIWPVAQALESPDEDLRAGAEDMMHYFSVSSVQDKVLKVLLERMQEPNYQSQILGAMALGFMGTVSIEAQRQLERLSQRGQPSVRDAATKALNRIMAKADGERETGQRPAPPAQPPSPPPVRDGG